MSAIQRSIRLMSILPLGKTNVIVLKPNFIYHHYGQYITHIRRFHTSSMQFNAAKKVDSSEKSKHISTLPRKTSVVPIARSDASFTSTSPGKYKLFRQRIVHELKHYYNGCKLLYTETKIAFRLFYQVLNGHVLTRRERKQFTRTVVDLFRLVPFSVFIIVPFMEFTLPIFLKLFPNMLPSTFKHAEKEKEYLKKQSESKLEVAKFLQDTAFKICSNDGLTIQFNEFIRKIRSTNVQTSMEKIVEFSSFFGNRFKLDDLNRSQLIGLCKLLNLSPIGPNHYLRFKLHLKFHRLKLDDKLIVTEGIENLNIEELQTACHERGMISFNVSIEHLQLQLRQWLDLQIDKHIPVIILLLSHGFYSPENIHTTTVSTFSKAEVCDKNTENIKRALNEKRNKFDIIEQLINQKAFKGIQELETDLNQTFSSMKKFEYLANTRSAKIIVQLTQTSDKRQEIR